MASEKTSQPYRPACSLEESVEAHSDTPFLDRSTPSGNTTRICVKAPVTPETPVRVRESNSRKFSLTVLTGDKG